MQDELALLKAVWPLILLGVLAFWMVWRNLGRRRNANPAKENSEHGMAGRSNWGDTDGGSGGDGD